KERESRFQRNICAQLSQKNRSVLLTSYCATAAPILCTVPFFALEPHGAVMSEDSLLDDALVRLDEAAAHLSIDPDVIEKLKYAREMTKVRLMIRMDDGSRKSFIAWRCRYDDTRGPTKGGIRFHPDATAEEVETLAFWMT